MALLTPPSHGGPDPYQTGWQTRSSWYLEAVRHLRRKMHMAKEETMAILVQVAIVRAELA